MRQISGEGNAAAQAECVLRRHGGGKSEGKEGVSNSPARRTASLRTTRMMCSLFGVLLES